MAEQDELFGSDNGQHENAIEGDKKQDIAGQGIAAGEIRVVEQAPKKKTSTRLLLLLLLVVLIGAGYFLYGGNLPIAAPGKITSTPKVAAPIRYPIEREVEVVVVDQQQAKGTATTGSSDVDQSVAPPETLPVAKQETAVDPVAAVEPAAEPVVSAPMKRYQILVGPYLTTRGVERAGRHLRDLGFENHVEPGRGPVSMTRLIEGVYPRKEAEARALALRSQLGDAFLIPSDGQWAVCVGSFTDRDHAVEFAGELAEKKIKVTAVSKDVEMNGRMLSIEQEGQEAAEGAVSQLENAGYRVRLQER